MDNFLAMSGFALAASISPGPVNLVTLSSSIQHGLGVSMRHVTGATVGFTLLLLLIGLGIHELLTYLPNLISVLKWLGVAFLLYMAFKLAIDDGQLGTQKKRQRAIVPARRGDAVAQSESVAGIARRNGRVRGQRTASRLAAHRPLLRDLLCVAVVLGGGQRVAAPLCR